MGKTLADYPELLKEWHPTKNGDLKPEKISYGSKKKHWWKCLAADDHEWEASVASRIRYKCPCCRGLKVVKSNCLVTTHEKLIEEWHPTKNGDLKPTNLTAGSNKKCWWICNKGHEWLASVNDRTRKESGCPYDNIEKIINDFIYSLAIPSQSSSGCFKQLANTCSLATKPVA